MSYAVDYGTLEDAVRREVDERAQRPSGNAGHRPRKSRKGGIISRLFGQAGGRFEPEQDDDFLPTLLARLRALGDTIHDVEIPGPPISYKPTPKSERQKSANIEDELNLAVERALQADTDFFWPDRKTSDSLPYGAPINGALRRQRPSKPVSTGIPAPTRASIMDRDTVGSAFAHANRNKKPSRLGKFGKTVLLNSVSRLAVATAAGALLGAASAPLWVTPVVTGVIVGAGLSYYRNRNFKKAMVDGALGACFGMAGFDLMSDESVIRQAAADYIPENVKEALNPVFNAVAPAAETAKAGLVWMADSIKSGFNSVVEAFTSEPEVAVPQEPAYREFPIKDQSRLLPNRDLEIALQEMSDAKRQELIDQALSVGGVSPVEAVIPEVVAETEVNPPEVVEIPAPIQANAGASFDRPEVLDAFPPAFVEDLTDEGPALAYAPEIQVDSADAAIAAQLSTQTTYVVAPGETLAKIAKGILGPTATGEEVNAFVVSIAEESGITNINRIYPGDELIIPELGLPDVIQSTYVVKSGDLLERVAQELLGDEAALSDAADYAKQIARANGINPNRIYPGQELIIPAPDGVVAVSEAQNDNHASFRAPSLDLAA